MKPKAMLTVLLFSLITAVSAQAGEVYLSVAASMTDVFKEMFADFSKTHADAKFIPNFGSSGALAKQVDQGAPADIFVSANQKWMKFLAGKNLIATGTEKVCCFNKLVFAGQDKGAKLSLKSLPGLTRIAIGTPESVPAGEYAKQAMVKAGIYDKLAGNKKLVMAKDVREALLYADRGEVDGAFVYKTDALLAKNAKILFAVPENMYDSVSYPMALTVKGGENVTAKAFYDYMKTPAAIQIIKKYGFEPAE